MFLLEITDTQMAFILLGTLVFKVLLVGLFYLVKQRKKKLQEKELKQKDV